MADMDNLLTHIKFAMRILIYITILEIQRHECIELTKWSHFETSSHCQHYQIPEDNVEIIETVQARSSLQCMSACVEHDLCGTVKYHPEDQTCDFYSQDTSPCDPNTGIFRKVLSNTCSNGGTLTADFQCLCNAPWWGPYCEFDSAFVDDCEGITCEHGGTCQDLYQAYSCLCQDGYTGAMCETDVDECQSEPCENGATCIDGVANFTCNCSLGFEGDHCEVNIDDCESTSCLNSGTCHDGINEFTCECPPNTLGSRCERSCYRTFENSCYEPVQLPKTYEDTTTFCADREFHLIEINNAEELDFLDQLMIDFATDAGAEGFYVWLGASDFANSGQLAWNSTGLPVENVHSNWAGNQPIIDSNVNNCVYIYEPDRSWYIADCSSEYFFICELWYP